ncbi:MAG: hypothetical protein ACKVQR_23765 [Aquabacterium sp.]
MKTEHWVKVSLGYVSATSGHDHRLWQILECLLDLRRARHRLRRLLNHMLAHRQPP